MLPLTLYLKLWGLGRSFHPRLGGRQEQSLASSPAPLLLLSGTALPNLSLILFPCPPPPLLEVRPRSPPSSSGVGLLPLFPSIATAASTLFSSLVPPLPPPQSGGGAPPFPYSSAGLDLAWPPNPPHCHCGAGTVPTLPTDVAGPSATPQYPPFWGHARPSMSPPHHRCHLQGARGGEGEANSAALTYPVLSAPL